MLGGDFYMESEPTKVGDKLLDRGGVSDSERNP